MNYDSIGIIGCGGLGSSLATMIAIKSRDSDFNFNKIKLVDPDVITKDDCEYGLIPKSKIKSYLNYPKVFALQEIISPLVGDNIKIIPFNKIYPFSHKSEKFESTFLVDCRDTTVECSDFKIKAACEGPYGKIILNPSNRIGESINYTLFPSQFYSFNISMEIINYIMNYKKWEKNNRTEIIVNMLKIGKL